MDEQALRATENFFHDKIPLTRAMGIRVVADDRHRFAIEAPVGLNHNHLQTAFGGSINAVATLAGYGFLWLEVRETAFSFPDDLPVVVDLTPERLADLGVGSSEVAEAGRLTNLFAVDYAAMLLDIEVARIATERSQQERARTALQAA